MTELELEKALTMPHWKRKYAEIRSPKALKSEDDIKTVQDNLGHATASFTLDVYGHVSKLMKMRSAQNMQHFIDKVS